MGLRPTSLRRLRGRLVCLSTTLISSSVPERRIKAVTESEGLRSKNRPRFSCRFAARLSPSVAAKAAIRKRARNRIAGSEFQEFHVEDEGGIGRYHRRPAFGP